jgi:hypothetical protein
MAGPTAPYYEDVRMPGSGALRVPTEAFPANLAVYKDLTLTGQAGTVTLNSQQASRTYFSITNNAAVTLVFPSIPGKEFIVNNLAASSNSVTVEVSGQSATPIAVAAGFLQHFVIDAALGVVPAAAAVAI